MASGWDKIQNGVIFGLIFGLVLLLYANTAGSKLDFVANGVNSVSQWLGEQTWMNWLPSLKCNIAGSPAKLSACETAIANAVEGVDPQVVYIIPTYLSYLIVMILGAIIGGYIDAQ